MASTIGFGTSEGTFSSYVDGGFKIDTARIVNDNCALGACMGLNKNEVSTLTLVGGGTFTLNSLSFALVGNNGELTFTTNSTLTKTFFFNTTDYTNNTEHVFTFSTPITNITSLVFTNTGKGNVRIDDINVVPDDSPHAVPGPVVGAGLPGLLVACGGLLALARRRRQAA